MSRVLLVGAGGMARAYAKVLAAEGVAFEAAARGEEKAALFEKETGVRPSTGGVEALLERGGPVETAIVAVGVDRLAAVTRLLLRAGARRILVEKPGGLDAAEVRSAAEEARRRRARVFVAYNRRFYASVSRAREMIAEDGGVTSFRFEFTEWADRVAASAAAPAVKRAWVLANSSHVIDLAFFLGGRPRRLSAFAAGRLPWHPAGAVFAGAGETAAGVPFSYHADWTAPGRWGVEVLTRKRRLVLRPLEELWVQPAGSLEPVKQPLDDADDRLFKAGVLRQTRAFLGDGRGLPTISEQLELARWAARMSRPGRKP